MLKHLMFKGNNITIPICGNTEIGKVVTFALSGANCPECQEALDILLNIESYSEAVSLMVGHSIKENLDKHKTTPSEVPIAILGDKDTFWKNIQKFEQ